MQTASRTAYRGADDGEAGSRMAQQLQRLLAGGRFAPMTLRLRDGRSFSIDTPGDVRVRRARGTIEIMSGDPLHEFLFEDLLVIEFLPALVGRSNP